MVDKGIIERDDNGMEDYKKELKRLEKIMKDEMKDDNLYLSSSYSDSKVLLEFYIFIALLVHRREDDTMEGYQRRFVFVDDYNKY